MSGDNIVNRFARPDTRPAGAQTAYAGPRMGDWSGPGGIPESWMGVLGGRAAEHSHPGYGASHANGWTPLSRRSVRFVISSFEEDAGPAQPPVQAPNTETARCANTGPFRIALDWMLPGSRSDRRQTA